MMAKQPAMTFNTGFGPLIPNAASSTSATGTSPAEKPYRILPPDIVPSATQPPPQTRSATTNLHPAQFPKATGKHRAQGGSQSGATYYGKHSALGRHGNMGTAATAQVNATPGYQGAHAKGAHAKPNTITPKNVTKVTGINQGNKPAYIPKHTAAGQAQRAQMAKKNQNKKTVNKTMRNIHTAHRFTRSLPKGKAIHEILASMRTAV